MSSTRSLFLVLLVLTAISVALFQLQPQIKYNLQDPIYHRLKARIFSPTPAGFDIAFIGSSHIWNAVDTEMLNRQRPGKFCYNFGVNWFGNDAKLVLIRDLLDHKPVRCVVLEITGSDDTETHHYFKFLATPADVMLAARTGWHTMPWRDPLALTRELKQKAEQMAEVILPFAVKGFYFTFREYLWPVPPVPLADHDGFLPISSVYDFPDKSVVISDSDDSGSIRLLSPAMVRIGEICRERHVKLYFLFVPQRNEAYPGKRFLAQLKEWGEPIVLDATEYYQPQYWYNATHLNTSGAKIFTNQLLQSALLHESN